MPPRAAALLGAALVLAVGTLGCTDDRAAEPSLQALQQALAEQEARNEASKQRIGELEAMLAADVCTRMDAAAALLPAAAGATPPR